MKNNKKKAILNYKKINLNQIYKIFNKWTWNI